MEGKGRRHFACGYSHIDRFDVRCRSYRNKRKPLISTALESDVDDLGDPAKVRGEVKDVAWGSQIRSYFLHPDQRVKDHRTGHEAGDAQRVLDGDLDDFIRDYLNKTAASSAN